jgi:hypothetical protein
MVTGSDIGTTTSLTVWGAAASITNGCKARAVLPTTCGLFADSHFLTGWDVAFLRSAYHIPLTSRTCSLRRCAEDRCILEFVQSHKFHAPDFVFRTDGVCRLNPEMARRMTEIVHETVSTRGSSSTSRDQSLVSSL